MTTARFTLGVVALPLAAALLGGAASAQSRWSLPSQQTQSRYSQWDSNRDGVITRAEWRGTREAFEASDWNRDGVLSGDEVTEEQRPVGTTGTRADRRAEFQEFDRDGDNLIQRREWSRPRAEFNAYDVNGDGVLTRREYVQNDTEAVARPQTRRASQVVVVDPKARWTDTGIFVNEGDTLTFNSSGVITMSTDSGDTARPAGSTRGRHAAEAPLTDALAGALLGRIGNSGVFEVGGQRTLRAPASGVLSLGVNDDHLADNNGTFRVVIGVR